MRMPLFGIVGSSLFSVEWMKPSMARFGHSGIGVVHDKVYGIVSRFSLRGSLRGRFVCLSMNYFVNYAWPAVAVEQSDTRRRVVIYFETNYFVNFVVN
jgi:hypothetical protein